MLTLRRVLLSLDVAYFLAVKNIFHRRNTLLLTVLIIGLGYLSATFSSSVIYGLQYVLEDKAITSITGHVSVGPRVDEEYLRNPQEVMKKTLSLPNVVAASSHVNVPLTIVDRFGTAVAVEAKVINPEDEAQATAIESKMIAGDYLSKGTVGEFIIGRDRTKKYGVLKALQQADIDAGEKVTVIFNNGVRKEMKVRGVYSHEFALMDIYAYLTEEEYKSVYNLSGGKLDHSSEIIILNTGRGHEDEVIYGLQSQGVSGRIWRWPEKLGLLHQFIGSLMVISSITAFVGIMIAFASIYIIIYINVIQKRAQIGMLKAMGINSETILMSYVVQSFFYGIAGAVFGTALTLVVIDYLTVRPLIMPVGPVVPIITTATLVGSSFLLIGAAILAGFFAAQGVVKDNILDAIFRG